MFLPRWRLKERSRSLLLLLPLVSLVLAIWACTLGPSRVTLVPPPVTHLPAAQLRLQIQIIDQYTDKTDVQVVVHFFEAATSKEVSLAEKATLTCNGNDMKPWSPSFVHSCPRQPPGGAYRIIYTDEHGAATTVVVPVPSGPFTILSPRDGSTVHIPTNGQLVVRYAIPIAPPNSSVTLVGVTAWCSVSYVRQCDSVGYDRGSDLAATVTPGAGVAYPALPTPSSSKPTATVFEYRGPPTPTPGPASTAVIPGATVTHSGGTGAIVLKGDFSQYQPGPGMIDINIAADIAPDRGAFAAATAVFYGGTSASITWTR